LPTLFATATYGGGGHANTNLSNARNARRVGRRWRGRRHGRVLERAAFGGEPGEGSAWDAIYQWIVLKTFHPVEAEIVAIALAFFPYRVLRGPIARIARWRLDTAL
jgi:hypothetical protein